MGLFRRSNRGSGVQNEIESEAEALTEEKPQPASTANEEIEEAPVLDEASVSTPDYSSEEAQIAMVQELVRPMSNLNPKLVSNQADAYHYSSQNKNSEEPSEDPPASAYIDEESPALSAEQNDLIKTLPPTPEDAELDRLRHLIMGREIEGLESIHRQLFDRNERIQTLSQIITEAIRLRVLHDDELIGVLKPTVDNIVRNSVRSNPNELADNLFPVIGPAIRRSISESIRSMLQDFSRTLEKSFSLAGLKWRMEAVRTGKPFSEVVLLKTLEYQVEQIFVIHAVSGHKLIHLVNPEAREEVKDPDQVAPMFTAIQQFVNDSFAQGELNTLEFGDRNILVTRAPKVYLACVVRGQPPSNLRIDMQTALELMVMECADDLDKSDAGEDERVFAKARHHFEALLISRFKGEDKELSFRAKMPLIILLLLLSGLLLLVGFTKIETNRLERMVNEKLTAPGLSPLLISPKLFGRWDIICLKDELVPPQDKALIEGGLPGDRFFIRYVPYISQDAEIVYKKLQPVLADRPEGMEVNFDPSSNILYLSGSVPIAWVFSTYEQLMRVPGLAKVDLSGLKDPHNGATAWLDEEGIMHFEGEASVAWQENVREQALKISGVSGVDLSLVQDDPATRRIKELVQGINNSVILFPLGKPLPLPQDQPKLEKVADQLFELEKLADSMDLSVNLIIYGHADATGGQKTNYELSQERAKTLAALLYARGCSIPISLYGMGSDFAPGQDDPAKNKVEDQDSRKIEMKVNLNRKGSNLILN